MKDSLFIPTVLLCVLMLIIGIALSVKTVEATHNPPAFNKNVRTGTVSLTNTDLTKAVTFSSAMPSSSYTCSIERTGLVASVLYMSAKGTSGFTLNITVGLTETVGYLCIEN